MERRIDSDEVKRRLEDIYLEQLALAIVSGNWYAIVYYRVRLAWLHRK